MCFDFGVGAAVAAAIATVASTAITAYGQYSTGKQQQAANEYNAEVANIQATDAERRGAMAEASTRTRVKALIGATRAEQGGSGTVADEGSSLDILAQTAEFGAEDAALARINAGRQAWGYRAQARLDQYGADVAAANIAPRVAGTAVTGATNLLMLTPWWRQWQTSTGYGYGYGNPRSPLAQP